MAPRTSEVAPATAAQQTRAEQVADFLGRVQQRTALYAWPVTAAMLARGRAPRLTRQGRRMFLTWRNQHPLTTIDLRAVEAEIGGAGDLFMQPAIDATGGMTLSEFAAWAGTDRRRLARHVIEVPAGPVPPLAVGQVPARRVGGTLRIFRSDFRGTPTEGGGRSNADRPQAVAVPAGSGAYRRQIDRLRDRFRHRS